MRFVDQHYYMSHPADMQRYISEIIKMFSQLNHGEPVKLIFTQDDLLKRKYEFIEELSDDPEEFTIQDEDGILMFDFMDDEFDDLIPIEDVSDGWIRAAFFKLREMVNEKPNGMYESLMKNISFAIKNALK